MINLTVPEAIALALQHHQSGGLAKADAIYRQILAQCPNHTDALHLRGVVAYQLGEYQQAIELIGQAIAIDPMDSRFHNSFGNVLADQGRLYDSLAAFQTAIQLNPGMAEAHNNMGSVLRNIGRLEEAVACYQSALSCVPDYVEAHTNLGVILTDLGRIDVAIERFRTALHLRPGYALAHNNLGNALKDQGEIELAMRSYREAIICDPREASFHSNLCYCMHFDPKCDAKAIYQEHLCWNRLHADAFKPFNLPHRNDRNPRRRLRVGYVSPDFRENVVGQFILPLLQNHEHREFEIFCYSDVIAPDSVTNSLRTSADKWRSIAGLSDIKVFEAIRDDQIDILVDLTMHMNRNRLLLFARKPAPLQVTYLAYCSTTGLEAMDYRITDGFLDPPGADESCYSERSIRLPDSYWCYQPICEAPDINSLPALSAGYVTFGCFNNFCKVSEETLNVWCQVFNRVSNSRLILHAKEGRHRDRIRGFLMANGINDARLEFVNQVSRREYWNLYHKIDLALDPFPYAGGTTSCDSLWMGVPVLTLCGTTAVGRAGASLLSNVGLLELIARSEAQYVEIAAEFSQQLLRLAELRKTLRNRMRESPLMNAAQFSRNVEAAYRTIWHRWCCSDY